MNNMWQLCPKCNGTGMRMGVTYTPTDYKINNYESCCDLCNGLKVISTLTGRPPQGLPPTTNTTLTATPIVKPEGSTS